MKERIIERLIKEVRNYNLMLMDNKPVSISYPQYMIIVGIRFVLEDLNITNQMISQYGELITLMFLDDTYYKFSKEIEGFYEYHG